MTNFHEELVAARRRGELLIDAPEPAEPERPADVEVAYSRVSWTPYIVECDRCHCLIAVDGTPAHSDRHRQIGY